MFKKSLAFLLLFSWNLYSSQNSDSSSYLIKICDANGDDLVQNDYLGQEAKELLEQEFANGVVQENLTLVELAVNHQTEEIFVTLSYSDRTVGYDRLK